MKSASLIGAVLILVIGIGYFFIPKERAAAAPREVSSEEVAAGTPTFTWSYREFENESIPYTEIVLTATYENASPDTRIIDTVEGNCNAYEPRDPDVYERSTMIICYYAGLGRYFKIVEGAEGYRVQRKVFEEASPDYAPPHQAYETITRFKE